jgi:hypothetical protein
MSKKNTSKQKTTATKTDSLAKYRAQAAPIIRILFDVNDDTPDFARDELYQILSELENQTQVFWNTREIAEVAIPWVLRAADQQGIDWQDHNSPFVIEALGYKHKTRLDALWEERQQTREPEATSTPRNLQPELEKDAEALARLLNSPYVPEEIKDDLANRFLEFTDDFNLAPEVIKAQYPLAVLKLRQESEPEGGARDEH